MRMLVIPPGMGAKLLQRVEREGQEKQEVLIPTTFEAIHQFHLCRFPHKRRRSSHHRD
jgi:hypothetical protein